MSQVVVDASVAVMWFMAEPLSDEAVEVRNHELLMAPDFLLIEVANALWKGLRKGEIEEREARVGLDALQRGEPLLFDSPVLVPQALHLAGRLDHGVYDCLYLALAVREDATVITADRRFHDRVSGSDYHGHTWLLGHPG